MEWLKITIDTPLSEVQEIHKRIWDYAIEHGKKPDTPYIHDCVLCEYAFLANLNITKHNAYNEHCCYCPAKSIMKCYECLNGLFTKWAFEQDILEKEAFARQIRDIPFKEEGYWKQDS